eukprot:g63840.t1
MWKVEAVGRLQRGAKLSGKIMIWATQVFNVFRCKKFGTSLLFPHPTEPAIPDALLGKVKGECRPHSDLQA